MSCKTNIVFGPIQSRRLGRSLGVDLLPFKTCPFDCVYCECNATTDLTLTRKEYCPLPVVLAEIDAVLEKDPQVDYLTFSGVGEPTLYTGIGTIVRHVKARWKKIRICLITNGVFLGDAALQNDLREIDLVMPSLDASCETEFQKINRPHPKLTLAALTEAVRSFRNALPHVTMLLEIFLVPGVNDSPESLKRFAGLVRSIRPDKLQLNSLDRPGVVDWIRIPERAELERIKAFFEEEQVCGAVEIISRAGLRSNITVSADEYNRMISAALKNGAVTASAIAAETGFDPDQVSTHLRRMEKAGILRFHPASNTYTPAIEQRFAE